jgi:hypothetical protein
MGVCKAFKSAIKYSSAVLYKPQKGQARLVFPMLVGHEAGFVAERTAAPHEIEATKRP